MSVGPQIDPGRKTIMHALERKRRLGLLGEGVPRLQGIAAAHKGIALLNHVEPRLVASGWIAMLDGRGGQTASS
jgi:hypothetical protein